MDTVTQVLLGASVGHATAGKQLGRRATIWGGILGLLPDLDVVIPFGDVVSDVTYHRSFSHSIPVMLLLTPLLVRLILRIHADTRVVIRRWYALVILALVTHTLLDCLTVYGTQVLWPLPISPVTWSTIFIIDPTYSIPLLIGVVATLLLHGKRQSLGKRINTIGLSLSCIYLGWTIGAKIYIDRTFHQALVRDGIEYRQLLTIPAPFNSLLWRCVAMTDDGYVEGFYSLVSEGHQPTFEHFPSEPELLNVLEGDWHIERLQWFTKGFYSITRMDDALVLTDLRMGMEPTYVFRYVIGSFSGVELGSVEPRQLAFPSTAQRQLSWIWKRIWKTTENPDTQPSAPSQ